MSAISLRGATKSYRVYRHGVDRLLEGLTRRSRHHEVLALHPISLEIARGEVVGVIGRNGAGKSTLLKLIAGTMPPSEGEVRVNGRVSALLELGSGFHPEMTGRENVFLSGAIMGIPQQRLAQIYDEIVDFSGIGGFVDQPVKTYSSGMFVRLAFAVATCVDPEILIVDEALSVGDGAFARKSFERIMGFKARGSTILFCSHSLYQVEALCSRVVWIEQGRLMGVGEPAQVIAQYSDFLAEQERPAGAPSVPAEPASCDAPAQPDSPAAPVAGARIVGVELEADGAVGRHMQLQSVRSDLRIRVRYASDPAVPPPSVALEFKTRDGRTVASAGSHNDGFQVPRDRNGAGEVEVVFPRFPLLKGSYELAVHLLCEQGVHVYESAFGIAEIQVHQTGLEQGVVTLPHHWELPAARRAVGA